MRVFVCGYPSSLGGADTELWHVLKLWKAHGIEATLIPTWSADPFWLERTAAEGINTVHVEGPDALPTISGLEGATVVSFCNGEFLAHAARFRKLGCRLVWVNCMTWLFPLEKRFIRDHGPFDAYVFQSDYQRDEMLKSLREAGAASIHYRKIPGAFDFSEFPLSPHVRTPEFVVGRLARPDTSKWSESMWSAVKDVPNRRFRLMGWSARVARKVGAPPPWAEVLMPCVEPALTFYRSLDALLAMNGEAKENWPRIGLEAMASGVAVVADNAWGWQEMIDHGRTGFLASSPEEFGEYLTLLASDEARRQQVIREAFRRLADELASPCRIAKLWTDLFCDLANRESVPTNPVACLEGN
jgi:glycosyltransferase involved in cell wall biosynthesis